MKFQTKDVSMESSQPKKVSVESFQTKDVSMESSQPMVVSTESFQTKEVSVEPSQPMVVSTESFQIQEVTVEPSKTEKVSVNSLFSSEPSCTQTEKWLQPFYQAEHLSYETIMDLCDRAKNIIGSEPNIKHVSSPVNICGDIHGQFYDLLELFRIGGKVPTFNYIFMGDYVDRGYYSVETFSLLLALKVAYPEKITLLRGNHESRLVSFTYGFRSECLSKYPRVGINIWEKFLSVFNVLNLVVLVDNQIMCVHGGLSPDVRSLNDISAIPRFCEIPNEGPMSDLVWSDPTDLCTWVKSCRGAGYEFGADATRQFTSDNGLDLIVRSHQLCQEGFMWWFDKKLVNIWSAPNYTYTCGNKASIMYVWREDADMNIKNDKNHYHTLPGGLKTEIKVFDAAPPERRVVPKVRPNPYFC
eukprot:TRINITY_DN6310_c0_g1_i1.p1 TRINITY_DN6310_c0_g1~~TRINITY_DN6310_c0_g1_i1.p1  ORF type:complete len:414 (+),score=60.75 TRINITY_DN6310_c0_g1_i1:267-1508(+)